MLHLEKGRPSDINGRLDKEIKVYDLLDSLNIEYERVDHEKADTMEACIEADRVLNTVLCKNLFLCNRQKTVFYLLLMPADKVFKTKELSAQIGSARLSFASPEDMISHLNIEPGSVSVMGLMNDPENEVNLLIDKDLMSEEYFGCHPCVNTSSLKIKTSDLINKFLPAVHHSFVEVQLFGIE